VPDLPSYEIERLRRSIAMLPSRTPAALNRESALELLDQLKRLQEEKEHEGPVDVDLSL
jgi:hypothetical protein